MRSKVVKFIHFREIIQLPNVLQLDGNFQVTRRDGQFLQLGIRLEIAFEEQSKDIASLLRHGLAYRMYPEQNLSRPDQKLEDVKEVE